MAGYSSYHSTSSAGKDKFIYIWTSMDIILCFILFIRSRVGLSTPRSISHIKYTKIIPKWWEYRDKRPLNLIRKENILYSFNACYY